MLSEDFKRFEYNYFTGHSMIRSRGEEDTTVWQRLKDDELERAKQMILDVLPSNQSCYMLAAAITRDERAIEKLKFTAQNGSGIYSRTYAAQLLFSWIGYDDYFSLLDKVYESDNQFAKISLSAWINGLKEEVALKYFWKAFHDKDSFVRYCAYGALEHYYGINRIRHDGSEVRYFTSDEVYSNYELYEARKKELEAKIEQWKDPEYVRQLNLTPIITPESQKLVTSKSVMKEEAVSRKLIKPVFTYLAVFFGVGSVYFALRAFEVTLPKEEWWFTYPWMQAAIKSLVGGLLCTVIGFARKESLLYLRWVAVVMNLLLLFALARLM